MRQINTNKAVFVARFVGADEEREEVDCSHVLVWDRPRDTSVAADGSTYVRAGGGELQVMLDSRSVVPRLESPCEVQFVDDVGKEWNFRGSMIAGDVFQFVGS